MEAVREEHEWGRLQENTPSEQLHGSSIFEAEL
jgi:hypothetical protein